MSESSEVRTAPPSRPNRRLALAVLLTLGLVAVGLAGGRIVTGLAPTASLPALAQPSRPTVPPPWPSVAGGVTYDAVFTGDATGATDVTDELAAFLESHNGQHVALAVNGIYEVTQVTFTARDLAVDFRGARLKGSLQGSYGILLIRSSSNIELNDPFVEGTGYEWIGGESNPDQYEHGIEVNSGSGITLNNPKTRDVRGDGIYVGFVSGTNKPPTRVVINGPNLERSSRNGIAPVAGEVSIFGGHIYDSGLHGVDFEPNNDEGAQSIIGIVDGVDIRRAQGLDVAGLHGYAVAAAGYSTKTKPSLVVTNLTGDELDIAIYDTASVIVRGNVSDDATTADFPRCNAVVFADNTRITRR